MPEFSRQDKLHMEAAEGWLGLGNHLEANEELECITAELRAHPEVLRVRYQVYAAAKKWEAAVDIAYAVSELDPDDPWGVLSHAAALHKDKKTVEAWDVLFATADQFKDEWRVFYDLARYGTQTGKLTEAFTCLARAVSLKETDEVKTMALDDPDLEPLWLEIQEI